MRPPRLREINSLVRNVASFLGTKFPRRPCGGMSRAAQPERRGSPVDAAEEIRANPLFQVRQEPAGWKPAIQLEKEPAIIVREPDATVQPTPQNNQLMSKHRVLSLKPQLRLEWRGQDGQSETEQPDHSASLGDSFTSSTGIRFSVHTPVRFTLTAGQKGDERKP
jgi:hypothetical protein